MKKEKLDKEIIYNTPPDEGFELWLSELCAAIKEPYGDKTATFDIDTERAYDIYKADIPWTTALNISGVIEWH